MILKKKWSFTRTDLIAHGTVTALTFGPHPGKLRLVVFDVVIDAHVLLFSMFPVQAARVLLKCSLP